MSARGRGRSCWEPRRYEKTPAQKWGKVHVRAEGGRRSEGDEDVDPNEVGLKFQVEEVVGEVAAEVIDSSAAQIESEPAITPNRRHGGRGPKKFSRRKWGEDRGGAGAWGELQSFHEAEGIEVVKQQDNRYRRTVWPGRGGHELTDSARETSTVKRSGATKIDGSGKSSPKSRNRGMIHSGQSDAEQPETIGGRVRIEGVFEVECNATSYKTTKTKQDKKRASDAYARLTQPAAGEQVRVSSEWGLVSTGKN
ncbi:hypothetical protein K438DRAFT_1944423 [Mycena galopus ATCC 62051]|nr:hypothetical protein K438DRAFT_1944423 [Mycena galopus ATCC 62051]